MNPAPGLYAISATNLAGATPRTRDAFGYFRGREPAARIGDSIYVYEVPPPEASASPPWLALCTAPDLPAPDAAEWRTLTGIPDLQVLSFDCSQSLVFRPGTGWVVLPATVEPVVDLGQPDYVAWDENRLPRFRAWRDLAEPPAPIITIQFPAARLPLPVAGKVELLGYALDTLRVPPGGELTLRTWWRVREVPDEPVVLFAYLQSTQAVPLASATGLGVAVEDLRPGMVVIQQHRLSLAADATPGSYALAAGVLAPNRGARYPVAQSGDRLVDRIVLGEIEVIPQTR